jgi:hypothetical protein
MRAKMNTKKILVSLCTIAIALFLVATVSAINSDADVVVPALVGHEISAHTVITIDGVNVMDNVSVNAGDTITVKVMFTASATSTEPITVSAEIEGNNVPAESAPFDVRLGQTYTKTLRLEVPSNLKDLKDNTFKDDLTLDVIIGNGDLESTYKNLVLMVQRPSYNPVVKSITTAQTIQAGETIPVDIVLKNLGYNDLNDLYVTVGISALGVEQTSYFGDLVTIEDCTSDCEEKDTVSGRIFLEVPYTAKAGVYTLEVKVANDDVLASFARQVIVKNELSDNVIVTSTDKTVAVGENAEYTLLLINPTNSLKVYKVIAETTGEVSSNVDNSVVAVPAGSSKTVTVSANAKQEGDYSFDVNVFSGDTFVSKVTLNLKAEGKTVSPIVVLTVILAIIFLVLLVVLIVLLGKKPQKSEEFGESYY